jgi:hypothetical protein
MHMANELKSLSYLFNNRLFRIPDYQRGYAWKDEQLIAFWEDLLNLHEGRNHYTGLLSLKALGRNDVTSWNGDEWLFETGFKPYHVVDGQQRLTTFSILIYEIVSFVRRLRENVGKSDEEIFLGFESLKDIRLKYILRKRPPNDLVTTYLFDYETDNPSADYLKYKVFEEPFGGSVFETYYTKNLENAKSFFIRNLAALFGSEGIDGIRRLYQKLTQKLMFNLHEIEDDYDVFVAFETMNNRGKRLTKLELLKNRLIYLTTLFDDTRVDEADKDQLRKNINDAWKEIYYQLGRNKEISLPDDDFLRAHWITYFRYSRKGGDDYIRFLLEKFSAKAVFEKHTEIQSSELEEQFSDIGSEEDDDAINAQGESEKVPSGKLTPDEIQDYVNSLKALAEYWYYSFFPDDSSFSREEKIWLDRLNRVGIGYFRPLVVAALSTERDTTPEERIALFKAIERFIFLLFRVGGFQASYQSSVYYNKSRDVLGGNASLSCISDELENTVNNDTASAITSFIARTNRRFDSGEGFYSWRDLRYFLYEYEHKKAVVNNLEKVKWNLFSRVEKDKVTIEHILPQTPTKWYWQNTYRMYSNEEIKLLSGSLGNLVPLSQSINSSLQNDSFPDKKNPPTPGCRGYINGSHSEIEVAQETDWAAENIWKRGLALLKFMETRWGIVFIEAQKSELLHIAFVNDGREIPAEKPETRIEPPLPSPVKTTRKLSQRDVLLFDFWSKFVEYCKTIGRGEDIASRKPYYQEWYDVTVGNRNYNFFFQVIHRDTLRIGIYVYQPEFFARLEAKKADIEKAYGTPLEWNTSKKTSRAKRVLHSISADVYNQALYHSHFDWLISQFDKLRQALESVDK